jgi:DNA/RNA-binding domain of Phe-tRNA-synthetase-like protein
MPDIRYRIDQSLFSAHPDYRRGVVVVRGANNAATGTKLQAILRNEELRLRERLSNFNIVDVPVIAAWRDAFRQFGAKPSEHRSSIEALTRRILKPDQLPSINPLVDIGNIVSLRHLLPAGVHPLPPAGAQLELRPTIAGDSFLPVDGSPGEQPAPGEIVFSLSNEVLTRRWTWRQAAGTQTLAHATEVFFNVDGLPPSNPDLVFAAMRDIEEMVHEHTGGRVVLSAVLFKDQLEFSIPAAQ